MWDGHSHEESSNPIGSVRFAHSGIKKVRPIDYKKKQKARSKRRKARKLNKR